MHNARTDRSGLTILYGSQTGNAQVGLDLIPKLRSNTHNKSEMSQIVRFVQDVAERIGREGKRRHFVPRIMAMDAFFVSQLPEEHNVILVSSTTGQASTGLVCCMSKLRCLSIAAKYPILPIRGKCQAT